MDTTWYPALSCRLVVCFVLFQLVIECSSSVFAHFAPRAKGDLYKAGPPIVSRSLLRIILFFRNFVGHPLGSALGGVTEKALLLRE